MAVLGKQMTFADVDDEYKQFVEKFKPKKTTDDCYTPQNIYDAVLDWAANKYGFDKAKVVRPFWPGGDYENFDYPDGCVVVDNPPFSILSKIVRFYMKHGVDFFLFAPALTTFVAPESGVNYICCGATITYENGAKVNTSFVTSLGEWMIETTPELYKIISDVDDINCKSKTKKLKKYIMPNSIVTSARLNWFSVHGVNFKCSRQDAIFMRDLDCRCELFGGAYLLSESATNNRELCIEEAQRIMKQKALSSNELFIEDNGGGILVSLSPRELQIQKMIGKQPTQTTQTKATEEAK